ncbi:MAG: ABC transporter permease [Bdellovibrionales bacterium]|nr:ABC transporter permease [Bdellovibrionales bacterium]
MVSSYLKHFFRTWQQHFSMQLATLVVLTATFTVIGISILIYQNLNTVLTQWGDSIRMSVFLKEENPEDLSLIEKFKSFSGLENYEYISKQDAANLFKKQVKNYVPDLLFNDEFENPLPASFELKFNKNWSNEKVTELAKFAQELVGLDNVEDVSYGQGWVKNYATVVDKFNKSSWFLVLILLFGSLFVIGNSIRSSISQRRDEIEVLELIGSTTWSIRAPYLFEGFLLGIISSMISLMVTYGIYKWQLLVMDSGLGILGGKHSLNFLTVDIQLLIILVGGIFGLIGSYICVAKINNGWAADQVET